MLKPTMPQQLPSKSVQERLKAGLRNQEAIKKENHDQKVMRDAIENRDRQHQMCTDSLRTKMGSAEPQHIRFQIEDLKDIKNDDFTGDRFYNFKDEGDGIEAPIKSNEKEAELSTPSQEPRTRASKKSGKDKDKKTRKNQRREKKRKARFEQQLDKAENKEAGVDKTRPTKAEAPAIIRSDLDEILADAETHGALIDNDETMKPEDIEDSKQTSPLGKYHKALIATIMRGKSPASQQVTTQYSNNGTKKLKKQSLEDGTILSASRKAKQSQPQPSIIQDQASTKIGDKTRERSDEGYLHLDDSAKAIGSTDNGLQLDTTQRAIHETAGHINGVKAAATSMTTGLATGKATRNNDSFWHDEHLARKRKASATATSGPSTSEKKSNVNDGSATQSVSRKLNFKEKKEDGNENWETKGRFHEKVEMDTHAISDGEEIIENLAFSSNYLLGRSKGVKIDGLNFQVHTILTNTSRLLEVRTSGVRICSVAQGMVRVALGDQKFAMMANGMWSIKAGEKCMARNIDDADVVIHVTTVNYR